MVSKSTPMSRRTARHSLTSVSTSFTTRRHRVGLHQIRVVATLCPSPLVLGPLLPIAWRSGRGATPGSSCVTCKTTAPRPPPSASCPVPT
ncbi:unnamed protein product, partial [Dibothriocephalus latus]